MLDVARVRGIFVYRRSRDSLFLLQKMESDGLLDSFQFIALKSVFERRTFLEDVDSLFCVETLDAV